MIVATEIDTFIRLPPRARYCISFYLVDPLVRKWPDRMLWSRYFDLPLPASLALTISLAQRYQRTGWPSAGKLHLSYS